MEIKIVATTGRAQGQAVEVRAAKFFIGRHDNCQLRPDIPGLAGIHALIEQRDDGLLPPRLRGRGRDRPQRPGPPRPRDRGLRRRPDPDRADGPDPLDQAEGGGQPRAMHLAPDGWPFLGGARAEPRSAPPRARRPRAPLPPAPSKSPEAPSSSPAWPRRSTIVGPACRRSPTPAPRSAPPAVCIPADRAQGPRLPRRSTTFWSSR